MHLIACSQPEISLKGKPEIWFSTLNFLVGSAEQAMHLKTVCFPVYIPASMSVWCFPFSDGKHGSIAFSPQTALPFTQLHISPVTQSSSKLSSRILSPL